MKKSRLTRIAATGFVVLLAASWVSAQDWPQWRGANRDGRVSGFAVPQKWPDEFTKKWSTDVGLGDSTPALVGDRLYVFTRQGDEEVTLCLDAASGKELWADRYAAQAVTGAAARHPGPRSSPAVANGKVITLGVGGILSCLDAASGKINWRKDPFPKIVPTFFTSMSPIIVDGMAVAYLGGQENGALMAYGLSDGSEKWRWSGEGPQYSSPVLMTAGGIKQIVALTEKSVVGVALSDGKLLWQLPFVPRQRAYNAATPIIEGETVIYTGSGRGTFAVKIERQADGFTAKELWINPELAPQFNTPVLKDGLLFGLTDRGNFFCINAKNGQTAWKDESQRDRSGFAAIVDVGPVILALPSSAELFVIGPTAEAYAELAKIKVSDTPVYAHPVLSGRRIFIKDQETLTLWTIE